MLQKLTLLFANVLIVNMLAFGQTKTVSSDKHWDKQQEVLKGTMEAEIIIRVGDVDNLGFGWPEDFDPFCGRMTVAHEYPWQAGENEVNGLDRILLSSKFAVKDDYPCGGDGYSANYNGAENKPAILSIPVDAIASTEIKNAWLQLFIDDFQSPIFCSKFVILINGKHFVEGEKMLNAIEQTGPVGKLISIQLTEDFYADLKSGKSITIQIDESTGTADGFALDFIRLLVNRNRENSCKGNVIGVVLDKATELPISGATVFSTNQTFTTTNNDGEFLLQDIPTGFDVISASASGYIDGNTTTDIGPENDNEKIVIYLEKGKSAQFDNKKIQVGESITLNNILFDQGKADLRPASKTELDKIVAFLQANPNAEIELSGHTSSEGDYDLNKSLSYKRVKSCKDYIVSKGISESRIIAVGFGPDKPVAPNDTESNRALNRRVEMRVMKL